MAYHSPHLSPEEFALFLKGDQGIFRMIFDMYYSVIYRYVQSLAKNQQEVDDITQQSFIQLFKHKSAIKDPSGIYPYLFTIAKRYTFMSFRKHLSDPKNQKETTQTFETNCLATERQIAFNDLHGALTKFIEVLPPKQGQIYRLSKLYGYSYEEISLETGCSKNTVKNQLISASKKIRSLITKHYLFILLFFFF